MPYYSKDTKVVHFLNAHQQILLILSMDAQLFRLLCNTLDCSPLLCPWDFFRQEYWRCWPFPAPEDKPKFFRVRTPISHVSYIAGGFFFTQLSHNQFNLVDVDTRLKSGKSSDINLPTTSLWLNQRFKQVLKSGPTAYSLHHISSQLKTFSEQKKWTPSNCLTTGSKFVHHGKHIFFCQFKDFL